MAEISRNAPCPCGSGNKYKKCCLTRDEEERRRNAPPLDRARRLHDLDARVFADLRRHARALGPDAIDALLAPLDDVRLDDDYADDAWVQLEGPYLIHHARLPDGRAIAERYLAERDASLPTEQRDWLAAQARAWFGLWDVLDVEPRAGMRLRDRLSGEERFVTELKGTAVLTPRSGLLGRVVDHDGISILCGIHPRPLPPAGLDSVEDLVRERFRRKRKPIEPDRLRHDKDVLLLVGAWEVVCAELERRPTPQLQNTDGEPLVMCTDVYTFERGRESELAAALVTIEGCQATEEEEDDRTAARHFAIFVDGNRVHAHWDNTIVAHLTLDPRSARLSVETNSLPRADRIRGLVESAGRTIPLLHERRTTKDPRATLEAKNNDRDARRRPLEPPALGEVPPPEIIEALRDMKERHYASWLDQKIPALGDQTPREAATTRAGRDRLRGLLREMEFHEGRAPEWQRFDVGKLRQELGVQT